MSQELDKQCESDDRMNAKGSTVTLDNRIRIKPALNRSSSCMTQESQKKERSNEKLQSVLGPVSFTLSDTGTTSNKASVSEAKLRDLLGDVPFTLTENDSHIHRQQRMARKYRKQDSNASYDTHSTSVSTHQFEEELSFFKSDDEDNNREL